jgi:hypothetical protein
MCNNYRVGSRRLAMTPLFNILYLVSVTLLAGSNGERDCPVLTLIVPFKPSRAGIYIPPTPIRV